MKGLKLGLLAAVASVAVAGAAQAEIKIGVATPITGPVAAIGEQLVRGAEMAVKDINAAGGVLGEQLVLVYGDDACEPKQALPVANQMVNEGVVFVAGHACSGATIPASAVYEEEGIIMITPSATNPTITEQGFENIFRLTGRDDQQGGVAGRHIAENYGDKKVAILHDKQSYGQGLADEARKALNEAGIQEVLFDSVNVGEKDYSALVSKLKQEGVEVLFFGGYHPELGLLVRQLSDQGADIQIIGGDALITNEYWSITGESGEGTQFTYSPDYREAPSAKPAVEAFRSGGYEPEGYTLNTYAAVQAWAQAANKAGTTDAEAVAAALRDGTFDTIVGPIEFDEKGDRTGDTFVIWEYQDGQATQTGVAE